jgi:hypothetical protein
LHGRETWSPTVREEHRLRLFKKRVLRSIFGPKREEVAGDCRRLHNEYHNLYFSTNITANKPRRMKWVRHVAGMG